MSLYGLRRRALQALLAVLAHCALAAPALAESPVVVLAFGDSLTAGFGLAPAEAFPAQLEARLRRDGLAVEVVNGGVSGDTSAGGLARLDWSLADKPAIAIVELGANDGLRGIEPKIMAANLDAILARLVSKGVKPLLAGMRAPPNMGRAYAEEFDAVFPALAKKHAVPLYPFFLDGVARDPKLNQPDGIHPTAEGVGVIVARIAPSVAALVRSVRRD